MALPKLTYYYAHKTYAAALYAYKFSIFSTSIIYLKSPALQNKNKK